MAFSPLPKTFIDSLSHLNSADSVVFELGSGQGHFRAQLQKQGCDCLGMDIRPPVAGMVCDVVGDARKVPLKPGSVSLLIAANLVRHLVPRHRLGDYISQWRGLLKPGGSLVIFEDEPSQATRQVRNFGDLQDFLAQLMPESRGPLMPLKRFKELVDCDNDGESWTFGIEHNQETINATEVVRFLAGGAGVPTGTVAGLIKSIGRDGLAPGKYWWAEIGPQESDQ